MNWFEAVVLGLIQGLTEFLPVSSSGHLEIGKYFFDINAEENFYFTIAVHGATVASTIAVFWKEILQLITGSLKFRKNEESTYVLKLIVSVIPVGIAGIFLRNSVEGLFNGNMNFTGFMLLVTSILLAIGHFIRKKERSITYLDSFLIGIAQALALIPGISRSGATISTGMMLGNRKDELAKFSFLMVLVPVLGANLLGILPDDTGSASTRAGIIAIGALAAFISGYLACRWMISLVRRSKMIWFSIYCAIVGLLTILLG
ncbi:MAG TPA: undecaprenyl-diphosphate phosphatase [Bacteroidales bacterium]|nr:undecaprenyl-diphosphate phosphatase [Bacteroidales bacterium]